MKILDLKIEGFRSLKSVHWQPGDVNVLIGPNAGGKSNLLQALEMIAESSKGKLAEFVKKQGGMQSIVWNGKVDVIKFGIETPHTHQEAINRKDYSILYQFNIERLGKTSSCTLQKEYFYSIVPDSPRTDTPPIFCRNNIEGANKINTYDIQAFETNLKENETALSDAEIVFREEAWIHKYRRHLSSWKIHSYFNTGPNSTIRQPIVASYETQVNPDGENLCSVIHSLYEENRDFHDEINSGIKAAFPDFEKLSFVSAGGDGRIQLSIWWKSLDKPQSAANLSDGTLRFLYLLTILADPEPPSLIAIDEPEAGLHPRMLPIIAEYALEASRRTQVVLATHSPEMLSAFGKRQTEVTVTVAEWEEGQTKLKTLEGDKLDYWLKEYTLGELFRSGELEDM